MSFADPQSIKIGETETSLPRVSTGKFESLYQSEDGLITLKASTVENRRKRQVIRLDLTKVTADPFIPEQNVEVSMSAYLVVDRPPTGYTNAEALAGVKGFITALNAGSELLLKKLLASES